jgi:hypothetical protein
MDLFCTHRIMASGTGEISRYKDSIAEFATASLQGTRFVTATAHEFCAALYYQNTSADDQRFDQPIFSRGLLRNASSL